MITPFDCYKEYLAIKNHFSSKSFDYFKYNGKVNANYNSFERRNDKIFFTKLAKHKDLVNFLVANLSENPKAWVKELAYSQEAEQKYIDWVKRQQSFVYEFKKELSNLDEPFDSNFICKDNEHPKLLKLYLSKKISLDTVCMLLEITEAYKHWNKHLKNDVMWVNLRDKIEKYIPFLNVDKEKIKKIVVDYFAE
jgi:uncharacterized protein YeaO (DUF488 family)